MKKKYIRNEGKKKEKKGGREEEEHPTVTFQELDKSTVYDTIGTFTF